MKALLNLVVGAAALIVTGIAHGERVREAEAVTIAEWWYARELGAETTRLSPTERQARLAARSRHQVHQVLDRDTVRRSSGQDHEALAYVVTFEPSGFVVVAADDSLQPVLAFNVTGSFNWDAPNRNYLHHFVGRSTAARAKSVRTKSSRNVPQAGIHVNWRSLRGKVTSPPTLAGDGAEQPNTVPTSGGGGSTLLHTAPWNQSGPYNDLCVSHCDGIEVPTGCTATAMAILMRYHRWPRSGHGSRSYKDTVNGREFTHTVNFGQHTYDWSDMPAVDLTDDNADVAKLMYHCGVAVEMDYDDEEGSGAWPSASAFNDHFRYRDTTEKQSSTPADHEADLIRSIRAKLPTVISTSRHTVVACGYRESDGSFFYLNGGHGGEDDGWFHLGDIDDASLGSDQTIDRSYPFCTPSHYVYVASDSESWFPNGALKEPYKKLADGLEHLPSDGVLMVKGGTYHVKGQSTLTLSTPMKINSYQGSVIINP